MKTIVALASVALALGACSKSSNDTTNVADRSDSAGMALENSAAELEATTDNLVDAEVANIQAASNASTAEAPVDNAN